MSVVRFSHMNAVRQLEVGRAYPALLPGLMLKGLSNADAVALAHNAAFLYHALELDPPLGAPDKVLERFSLAEIARLCEQYAEWVETQSVEVETGTDLASDEEVAT